MRLSALMIALVLAAAPAAAQGTVPADSFVRREVMIPMRDGTQLFTVVLTPANRSAALPILFERTPYGANDLSGEVRYFARELGGGYIFAFQDIRGRNRSQGTFVMTRPPTGPVDESTDTWDAIDWLVKHAEGNNGRVGMFGVSYDGWLTDMALIHPHPALKAVSPQATVGDFWMGDDFFHQGAFRLSYGLEYSWMMEASNDQSDLPRPTRFDTYDWYRSFPTLDSLARAVGAARWPTWRRFTEHPAWDSVWQNGALTTHLRHTTVPTLTVGGWWDQEDLYGPQATYRVREATDTAGLNHLVLGPWFHGQWAGDSGDSLGLVRFGSATGVYFRREIQAPWFAYWLKGEGDGRFPEARVFDAGAREWRAYDRWPPAGAVATRLYFGANGRLSFTPPPAAAAADSFVSDPARPVPYRPRPVEWTYDRRGSRWYRWMTEDQRFVDGRPDVLVWQTEPLDRDVAIAGDVRAVLYASTTGTDADWVVKLIDVYPDSVAERPRMGGYELMVAGDVMRGRYRRTFERAEPVPANTVLPFTVDLHQQAYTFRRGHRIMVQVQSTWFPLYDRNPQTFVPNIFHAQAGDYRAQTHRIVRSAQHPSHVQVMVLPPAG
ncbi:MAG TPA: CocE/NonD family hydrolase [Longimicrobium sp.]|nr:CocE/NonD family hydrolase [Longimicrobium sp.]